MNDLIDKEIAKEADLPPSPAGTPAPGSEPTREAGHDGSIAPPSRPPIPPTER